MKQYFIGRVTDVYGEQYGDNGGSSNYCYRKYGFLEGSDGKKYYIENMVRREIPFDRRNGLTRTVYWNKGQKALYKVDPNDYGRRIEQYARLCGVCHDFDRTHVATILGVIDKDENLIVAELDKDRPYDSDYSHYRKIPLSEFLANPDESFLVFYAN